MLDIKTIRENPEQVRAALIKRGADLELFDQLLAADLERRQALTDVDRMKGERNRSSKAIGAARAKGEETAGREFEVRTLGDRIRDTDARVRELDQRFRDLLLRIPNTPHAGLPVGPDASGNRVARVVGAPRVFDFVAKTHVELGETLGMFDFPRAARMTGAGFPLYLGQGARLERALVQFMLDFHVREHGYVEMSPPFVVNSASMYGTGQLPKMAEDMYAVPGDDLWLIPTAEVPVTNYLRDEIIERPLPIAYTAYTPCFRREAGSAGKETRGLIRVHQFDKVEMVRFVEPATSYEELEKLVGHAEDILKALGLHYRVLELCTGDISFAAAKCYDLELWAPGQNGWLEVSSCSNFEGFQARRANIRYRRPDGKLDFVHTLNGSGVALARLVVALMENGQQADGTIVLPAALVPYMGGVSRLTPGA